MVLVIVKEKERLVSREVDSQGLLEVCLLKKLSRQGLLQQRETCLGKENSDPKAGMY